MSNFATDYIDVATRIAEVRGEAERHYPEGSFQPLNHDEPFRVVTVGDKTYLAYVAAFYRTPDDKRPGVGAAWEQVPGRTRFTEGSELQNAETSAWGRALVAALAADTKKGGIASADEVRNRQAEHDLPRAPRRRNATTRSGAPDDPTQVVDEWTTPAYDLEDARRRLTAAGNAAEIEAIVAEVRRALHEHRLAPDEATGFKAETDQRLAELTGALT